MAGWPDYAAEERVVGTQARVLAERRRDGQATSRLLDAGIERAEALAARLNVPLPAAPASRAPMAPPSPPPSFAALAGAARRDAGLHDVLDAEEIDAALARLHLAGLEPRGEAALDAWDCAVAGIAGLLAGLADVVLVGLPRNPLTRFGPDGGPLPNHVRSALGRLLPPDTVAALEAAYPVPFDPSTGHRLLKPVPGLCPPSHRFQSLGHDPLLGWLFGVRDVLAGTFTAIGRDGVLVTQAAPGGASSVQHAFCGLLEAFRRVGGHMVSDVSTPMGLPAPLLPLAQFLQFGGIGPDRLTIAELSRRMYLQGYDFRFFAAGGLVTLIVEVVVRGVWLVRRLHEGLSLEAALPRAAAPRLRRQLLLGHGVAVAVNAGKVAFLHDPLALNWAQWMVFLRCAGRELIELARVPGARFARRDAVLDEELLSLSASRA